LSGIVENKNSNLWRICGKYLAVFGDYAESILAYMKNTTKLGLFAVLLVRKIPFPNKIGPNTQFDLVNKMK
jgi:hypothetical protein